MTDAGLRKRIGRDVEVVLDGIATLQKMATAVQGLLEERDTSGAPGSSDIASVMEALRSGGPVRKADQAVSDLSGAVGELHGRQKEAKRLEAARQKRERDAAVDQGLGLLKDLLDDAGQEGAMDDHDRRQGGGSHGRLQEHQPVDPRPANDDVIYEEAAPAPFVLTPPLRRSLTLVSLVAAGVFGLRPLVLDLLWGYGMGNTLAWVFLLGFGVAGPAFLRWGGRP